MSFNHLLVSEGVMKYLSLISKVIPHQSQSCFIVVTTSHLFSYLVFNVLLISLHRHLFHYHNANVLSEAGFITLCIKCALQSASPWCIAVSTECHGLIDPEDS